MDLLISDSEAQDYEAQNSEAQDGVSNLEANLRNRTNRQIARAVRNPGRLRYIVDFVLGANQSEPIWRLRLLATVIFVVLAMFGAFFLPKYLHEFHATYQRVMLITSVGAPVAVAAIRLFVSFWLPSERTNWITGLLVANISMLAGAVVVYLALQHGTGN